MQRDNYYSQSAVNARRKARRSIILKKRIFICVITVFLSIVSVWTILFVYGFFNPTIYDGGFVPEPFGKNISKRVKEAKQLVLPDWVEQQFIHIHTTARTGIHLTDVKNIVIHYVGNPNTTAQNNRDYFDKESTTVSSHFVVGLDGEIIQCLPLYEKSAASNERNKDTISIEVCHPDETGAYSKVTYDALIKLVAFLCENFSLDENDVIRHYDITGKICPKYYVENKDAWDNLIKDVKEKLNENKKKD